ncbi:hypothetical protein C8Q76DRAFT_790048 [Earliella scabrosa]|nr:hypothetical protein C8Q76DRAFT_790048 [Earliella scabrosa]
MAVERHGASTEPRSGTQARGPTSSNRSLVSPETRQQQAPMLVRTADAHAPACTFPFSSASDTPSRPADARALGSCQTRRLERAAPEPLHRELVIGDAQARSLQHFSTSAPAPHRRRSLPALDLAASAADLFTRPNAFQESICGAALLSLAPALHIPGPLGPASARPERIRPITGPTQTCPDASAPSVAHSIGR